MTSIYTIQQLKSDWEAMLHGTSLNEVQNPFDVINRAARDVLADVDLFETKRRAQFANGIFDTSTRVYNYLLPPDLKLDKVIDIQPQVNRFAGDNFIQHPTKEFDLYKAVSSLSVDNDTNLKYIRISAATVPPVVFNDFEALTGSNGTNSADGVIITTLAQDTLYKVAGTASLSFNVSGAGTGTIVNSTLSSTDLATRKWQGSAAAFVWVYIPSSPTSLTNVTLRWGSSATDYWEASATTNFWSQAFVTGWNLLQFTWPTASTGTPDASKLTYLRAALTWTGAATNNFRIDRMFFALPTLYDLVYYSKYLFQDSTGAWKELATDDTDLVNLDTHSYNILLYKIVELTGLQVQQAIPMRGKMINFDFTTFGGMYDAAVKRYKENYKTEALRQIGTYYRNRYIRYR